MNLSRRSFVRYAATAPLLAVNEGTVRIYWRPSLIVSSISERTLRNSSIKWTAGGGWPSCGFRSGADRDQNTLTREATHMARGSVGRELQSKQFGCPMTVTLSATSPSDLRTLFYADGAERSREYAVDQYRTRSAQLIRRLRARRSAQRTVGLPIDQEWQVIETELESVEARIDQRMSRGSDLIARG